MFHAESLNANRLYLEKTREADNTFQKDKSEYELLLNQVKHLLSVRMNGSMKKLISSAQIRIINKGKADAFVSGRTIYFDIALLDLLLRFSKEFSVAEVKSDIYHIPEFKLMYAVALNSNKTLETLLKYETLTYSEEQQSYLWKNEVIGQEVIFNQLLGFILAHEISHMALHHEQTIQQEFPSEESRTIQNPVWNRRRREMELDADRMAAHMCLNSLIEPAQLLPWLDLTEVRRRYYGKSDEYPTSSQRIFAINQVEEMIYKDKWTGNLNALKPLPAHMNIFEGDYYAYLEEFRRVRTLRQQIVMYIDKKIAPLIYENYSPDQVATSFIKLAEGQKDIFRGAENQKTIEELQEMISSSVEASAYDPRQIKSLLQSAGIGKNGLDLLGDLLNNDQTDRELFQQYLMYLKNPVIQYYDAITYDYLLANSIARWLPEIFSTLQQQLPENEVRAKNLKPFQLDRLIRNLFPTFEQRLYVLKAWDGKY